MKITATRIESWADTREAQGLLPVLIRRLIAATSNTTALVMRGGDSVGEPGWDGLIDVTEGSAWVPVGKSRWEMGCSGDVFHTGVLNNRGVTTRGATDGGDQERTLAEKYEALAARLQNSHPLVAATLTDISKHYQTFARRHDWDAQLRIEGH